jgi:hypothetical protein
VKLGTSPGLSNGDRHRRRQPFFGKLATYPRSGRLRRERRGHTFRVQLAEIPDIRKCEHEMTERGDRRPCLQHLRCLLEPSQQSVTRPGTDPGYLLNCAGRAIGNNFFWRHGPEAGNRPGPGCSSGYYLDARCRQVCEHGGRRASPTALRRDRGNEPSSPHHDPIERWDKTRSRGPRRPAPRSASS